MDTTKCTSFFVFLVLLSVTILMSEASKVPPKPRSSIDPNCYSPGSSLDFYSRASLYPPPSDAVKSLDGEFCHPSWSHPTRRIARRVYRFIQKKKKQLLHSRIQTKCYRSATPYLVQNIVKQPLYHCCKAEFEQPLFSAINNTTHNCNNCRLCIQNSSSFHHFLPPSISSYQNIIS